MKYVCMYAYIVYVRARDLLRREEGARQGAGALLEWHMFMGGCVPAGERGKEIHLSRRGEAVHQGAGASLEGQFQKR